MAASSDDVPSQEEVDRLREARDKALDEWESLEREVKGLKLHLESTEQDEERKLLTKEINLKDIKTKLAEAKYRKAHHLYWQRRWEKERATRSGQDVTEYIRLYKERVVKYEEEIEQHQQRLLEMEQEEATEQSPLQSSGTTAASNPLFTHSSMTSSDHGPGAHLPSDSRVQLPPPSNLNLPQTREQLSAVTTPGPNLPLRTDQYSHLSNLQISTTAFTHAQPSTSSAAHLPEIPDIRYVTSQPATSQQTQQHLPAAAVSTVPSPNLPSSDVQPSGLSSMHTIPTVSIPTSQAHSAQLPGDVLPSVLDYASTRRVIVNEPTQSGDHDAPFTVALDIQRHESSTSDCSSQSASETTLRTNVLSAGITASSASRHTPDYSTRKPALHELDLLKSSKKTVRIIDRIAPKWDRVAIRLHFETHEIEGIERDCQRQTSDASHKMIRKWLNGGGGVRKPITWATLIEALDEADLSEVAKDIVSILQESDT